MQADYDKMLNATTTVAYAESEPAGASLRVSCETGGRVEVTVEFDSPLNTTLYELGRAGIAWDVETPYMVEDRGKVERGVWAWIYLEQTQHMFADIGWLCVPPWERATTCPHERAQFLAQRMGTFTMRVWQGQSARDYAFSLAGSASAIQSVYGACPSEPRERQRQLREYQEARDRFRETVDRRNKEIEALHKAHRRQP